MKRFRHFITEGKYPLWLRFTVGGIVLRIKNLQNKIDSVEDPVKKTKIISKKKKIKY